MSLHICTTCGSSSWVCTSKHIWISGPTASRTSPISSTANRIDLCIVGGITEAAKITHWAETHYINIAPHNPLGPVSAAACVALCMASTNVGVQELPRRPGTYATELFPQQIEWDEGFAWCPDTPGLGVDIDMEVAERSVVDPQKWPPRLRREDGSMTNW